ncbi:hypothetical protein QN277_026972 [Acacia crassicarpa]|uniref:Uncharacterized protein n=1 Tax=Acacia crassicarpa TaxID=499986 RepID=A0AAE1JDA3_9FABA|nr:hypothetical protein QN277_026972 [Acacia crassicarpa]
MEKLIYVHVARLGDSLNREKGMLSGYDDATNDWYVIKQSGEGRGNRVKMSRVFEGAGQLNHPYLALLDTDCVVIGSLLYVIGGCCILCDSCSYDCSYDCNYLRSTEIRCLDIHNPQDRWRACFTLPFKSCVARSIVVDRQWLYVFPFRGHWCYGLNIEDGKSVLKFPKPNNCTSPPSFATSLSPGTLVAYKNGENTLYQLDCKNSAWTVYHKDFLPYSYEEELLGSSFAVDDDGIVYIYLRGCIRLISFDIRNKKELHAVDLPRRFWFGVEDRVQLIFLSKNKFCLLWDKQEGTNKRRIYYSRFSVSYDDLSDPILDMEETRSFLVAGCRLLNVVTVDPPADVGSSRVDVSGGGEKPK